MRQPLGWWLNDFTWCPSDLGWDHSCDVWSVGCILIEYYLGSTLFQVGNSTWQIHNPAIWHAIELIQVILFPHSDTWQQRASCYDGASPGPHSYKPPGENKVRVDWKSCLLKLLRTRIYLNFDYACLYTELTMWNELTLKQMFCRKRRYVHRNKLDWDVHSSAGRYVKKHCRPLKVRITDGEDRKSEVETCFLSKNIKINFLSSVKLSRLCSLTWKILVVKQ